MVDIKRFATGEVWTDGAGVFASVILLGRRRYLLGQVLGKVFASPTDALARAEVDALSLDLHIRAALREGGGYLPLPPHQPPWRRVEGT